MCGSPPSAPQLPQYPNPTGQQNQIAGQQQSNLGQYGNLIQGLSGQLGNNQSVLQSLSGLFGSNGQINQTALNSLQQQIQQGLQTQGSAGHGALNYVNNLYGQGGALQTATNAFTSALTGGAPANQQLAYNQNQSFQQLQQQAAAQGIQINGTNFSNAVSSSTAGQKLIQNFQQNANLQNQNYQLGYLQQTGQDIGNLTGAGASALAQGQSAFGQSTQTPTQYLAGSISGGQSALAPYLQNYQSGLGGFYNQLEQQALGPYQQQGQQAQENYGAGFNQYNSQQNQMMGWAQLGSQAAPLILSAAGII